MPDAWLQRLHARWPCASAALLLRAVEAGHPGGGLTYFNTSECSRTHW